MLEIVQGQSQEKFFTVGWSVGWRGSDGEGRSWMADGEGRSRMANGGWTEVFTSF